MAYELYLKKAVLKHYITKKVIKQNKVRIKLHIFCKSLKMYLYSFFHFDTDPPGEACEFEWHML